MTSEMPAPSGATELKSHTPDVTGAVEDMMRGFESFKETNNERLAKVERKVSVDVLLEEKLGRIEAALDQTKRRMDEIALKSARPALGGPARALSLQDRERKTAFEAYVRRGEAAALAGLEEKGIALATSTSTGF